MAQGWVIDATADTITFLEAPPVGVNNVVVVQYPTGGTGGTDVWAMGAWSPHFGYPSEVEFFSDRFWAAGSTTDPQVIWASATSDYNNFGQSSPIVDSDRIVVAINARQVNAVRDLVPLDTLLAMTTGGEFALTGGADDVVTPSTVRAKGQSKYGSGDVPALVMGDSAILLQNEGQKVRDMSYLFEKDGFRGNEISIWADHLFAGYTITGMEFWKAPYSVVWFSRDDGVRLGCTYLPEQEVIGWHWHDTAEDDLWLDACALPGTIETECYFLAEREVDGVMEQFIEQQAPSFYDDPRLFFYVDSGLSFDGRNTGSTTVTITTNTGGWTEADDLVITASAAIFTGASDVGDAIFLYWTDYQEQIIEGLPELVPVSRVQRMIIDTYISPTQVGVHPSGEVPESLQAVAWQPWGFARDTLAGLWHLEGREVNVLQDGAVAGPFTVSNGRVTLAEVGCVGCVGHGYTGEIETLELNAPGGEPMRDVNKLVTKVSILVNASRGLQVQDIAARGLPLPFKERSYENYGDPPILRTGIFEATIPAQWGVNAGRVRLLSRDPLPCEILGITLSAAGSVRP